MTHPVVVGVDGTPQSAAAAAWAAEEAQRRDAPLSLLQAWTINPTASPELIAASDPEQSAELVLSRVRDRLLAHHPNLELTAETVADSAVTALVSAAERAQLLVVGTRGLGALGGFLLGSVSSHVIARAVCPVVAVRASQVGQPTGEVVVGVKRLHASDADALDFAFATAARGNLPVRVLHAWHAPPSRHGQPSAPEAAEQGVGQAAALADLLKPWRADHPDLPVSETLLVGNASQALIDAATRAALVVVGRSGHRPGHGTRVGAVTHALLHHSLAPVAVVPPSTRTDGER
ncbi:universal stress protein [Streptomyces sp. B6B3]|uniref:universal stress protein n=1 Tax=Streptomyces sp. B6B3 TaxID=3153570 RepID=UPI00325C9A49